MKIKYLITILLCLFICSVHAQSTSTNPFGFQCYTHFEPDTNLVLAKSGDGTPEIFSEHGQYLPASGTIPILIIYAEIEYTDGGDPVPSGTAGWPAGALPIWADDLVETQITANPQAQLTKYFKDASSGNLNIIGDYLLAPQNNGVFKFKSDTTTATSSQINALLDTINTWMNGNFITYSGITDPLWFDLWEKSSQGKQKALSDTSSNRTYRYDHVMIIFRNKRGWNNNGQSINGTPGTILGHGADSYTLQASLEDLPIAITRHEFAHLLVGGNAFHCTANPGSPNHWIPNTSGHSILGGARNTYKSWNAWDRYWLGWKDTSNQHLISARTVGGSEINADLDATIPGQAGTYVIRDFVETGDALRIKLPFINPAIEYEQWLWLENHRGYNLNGNIFDKYNIESGGNCVDPAEWGLSVSIQIDKNLKTAASANQIYTGFSDYYRPISADGMWERQFDSSISDACGRTVSPSEKLLSNPLSGWSDLDGYPQNLDTIPTILNRGDEILIASEEDNGTMEHKTFFAGNPRQVFRIPGKHEISIGTNPSSANQMSQAGDDEPEGIKNVRKIYMESN